jgi:hypothetical protein
MPTEGFVRVAADSTGKRVSSLAVTLPAGTRTTDKDGLVTILTADTTVFVQHVLLVDESGEPIDVAGMVREQKETNEWLSQILDALTSQPIHTEG